MIGNSPVAATEANRFYPFPWRGSLGQWCTAEDGNWPVDSKFVRSGRLLLATIALGGRRCLPNTRRGTSEGHFPGLFMALITTLRGLRLGLLTQIFHFLLELPNDYGRRLSIFELLDFPVRIKSELTQLGFMYCAPQEDFELC